jgi:hypothetical protein
MEQEKPATAWENPIRVALRQGKPVFGATISTPSIELRRRWQIWDSIFYRLRWSTRPLRSKRRAI